MHEPAPAAVDAYLERVLLPPDTATGAALAASRAAGLPPAEVSPLQARLLGLLARLAGAQRILELGTLGGISTIALARALPAGGRLVTLERDPAAVAVARSNLERAGVAGRVELVPGDALETLATLSGPFDLVFLDADKERSAAYLEAALRLSRPGTLIVADNVVRGGAVADAGSDDPRVHGVRDLLERLGADGRVEATALQTVGAKGWDGFALALVRAPA